MDGVLADTTEAHFRTWVTSLAEWEIPLDRDQFGSLLGMNSRDSLTKLLGRSPTPVELTTIIGRKEYLFRLEAQRLVHPVPGALNLLNELEQAGWSQALATSAPQANIDLLIDKFGIRDRFQAILSGAELSAGKPDPTLFLMAAEAVGLAPARCVVVEDSPAGVEAAGRAGMRCIAVATTHKREALTAADRVFDGLTQMGIADFSKMIEGNDE
jgi:HAD superfamily hydrolase (TIGR01509 family)